MESRIKKPLWRHGQSTDMVEMWVGVLVEVGFVITQFWVPRVLFLHSGEPKAHTVGLKSYYQANVRYKALSA